MMQFTNLENGDLKEIKDYASFLFDRYRKFFTGDNLQYMQAQLIYEDEFQGSKTPSIPNYTKLIGQSSPTVLFERTRTGR